MLLIVDRVSYKPDPRINLLLDMNSMDVRALTISQPLACFIYFFQSVLYLNVALARRWYIPINCRERILLNYVDSVFGYITRLVYFRCQCFTTIFSNTCCLFVVVPKVGVLISPHLLNYNVHRYILFR